VEKPCILGIKDGRVICPVCGRKTDQAVTPTTTAEDLVIFCKWCKHELTVKIEKGKIQCQRQRLSARARA